MEDFWFGLKPHNEFLINIFSWKRIKKSRISPFDKNK